jgi:hypothetical protein
MGLFAENSDWGVMTSDDPEHIESAVSSVEKLPCPSGSLCKEISQGVKGILSDKAFLQKLKALAIKGIDGFVTKSLFSFINTILSEVFDRVQIDEKNKDQLKADIKALKEKLSTVDDLNQLKTVLGQEFANSDAWKEVIEGFEDALNRGNVSLAPLMSKSSLYHSIKSDIQPLIKKRLAELIDDISDQLDKEGEHTAARKEVDSIPVS